MSPVSHIFYLEIEIGSIKIFFSKINLISGLEMRFIFDFGFLNKYGI